MGDATAYRLCSFKKGDLIFDQNDTNRDLFVIKSGSARVFKIEGGVEIDLETVQAGGVLGEVAAIDGGTRSAGVKAIQDTEAYVISEPEFAKIMASIPDWYQKIARILVQRLREADRNIDATIEADKTGQVAAITSLVCSTSYAVPIPEGGFSINTRFLEDELLALLPIQLSEIDEAFQKLAKKGLLAIKRTHIHVPDPRKLEQESSLQEGKCDKSEST